MNIVLIVRSSRSKSVFFFMTEKSRQDLEYDYYIVVVLAVINLPTLTQVADTAKVENASTTNDVDVGLINIYIYICPSLVIVIVHGMQHESGIASYHF